MGRMLEICIIISIAPLEHFVNVPVNGIMLPSSRLLHTNTTPFGFRQETALGQSLGQFLRKNHMSVSKETKLLVSWCVEFNVTFIFRQPSQSFSSFSYNKINWCITLTCIHYHRRHTFHCIQCERRSWCRTIIYCYNSVDCSEWRLFECDNEIDPLLGGSLWSKTNSNRHLALSVSLAFVFSSLLSFNNQLLSVCMS